MTSEGSKTDKSALKALGSPVGAGPLVIDTLDATQSQEAIEDKAPGDSKAHALDLNRNLTGTISNPLESVPRSQLLVDAAEFARTHGLTEHTDLIQRGALVAQSPQPELWDDIPELSSEEREALTYEHNHQWSQTAKLWMTIFVCSLGAATQGWDQTGSNAANTTMTAIIGIPNESNPEEPGYSPNWYRNTWLLGLVNAGPYIGSALIGCCITDLVNGMWGRRGAIFLCALILIITPICSGLTQKWWELLIVRLLLGIGMGIKGSTTPVFCAEQAPAAIRGALVLSWQMWTAFGIFIGTVANVIVKNTGANMAWRLQLGSAFIPAVPLALCIYLCPESPRWLMMKERHHAALQSLLKLRKHSILAARDLYYIHVLLQQEKEVLGGSSMIKRVTELFTIPRVRRATVASGVVMAAQQMCGINIIAFYSSTVFKEATGSVDTALYASIGFGALNWVFCFPAVWTIDRFGRRPLLLWTFPLMAVTLLGVGLCFLIPDTEANKNVRIGFIALFIYLFTCAYSPGEGPVPFTYSAEVFPLAQRAMGMAWAVAVCFGLSAVLSICFPAQLAVFTPTGAFGFFAGTNVLSLVLIFLFVRETKQLTLEEIDQVFAVPQSVYIKYQLTQTLPFWFKRYICFDRSAKLTPLLTHSVGLKPTHKTEAVVHEMDKKESP